VHQVVCHFPILYDHNVSPRSGQSRFQHVTSEPGQPIAMLHDHPNHLGIPQDPEQVRSLSVHPGADVGHHCNRCPPLFVSNGLKAVNVPFQIRLLVSGGHAGVEHRGTF
jgi:hypothetical protein